MREEEGTCVKVPRDRNLDSKVEYFRPQCNIKRATVLEPLQGVGLSSSVLVFPP